MLIARALNQLRPVSRQDGNLLLLTK